MRQESGGSNADAQFLGYFSYQAFNDGFSALQLSAGQIPHAIQARNPRWRTPFK
jgi:hypothetical protein